MVMKKILLLFTVISILSCSSRSNLSNEQASLAIQEYYSDKGCFSKLDRRKIEKLNNDMYRQIEKELETLKDEDMHKTITWELETINGVMVSQDGNLATVDFTLNSKKTKLYSYQKYLVCGDEKSDFGPWNMVVEFTKYDTGWKIKSKPKGKE